MITLDEKTARQVLDVLERWGARGRMRAIEALRQALEQKPCDMGQMCLDCQPRELNGECPDQQLKQEPVAWMWKFEHDEGAAFSTKKTNLFNS